MAVFTVVPKTNFSKVLFVENAGAAEVDPSFKAVQAITITAVATICVGTTPSVTWQIRHASSATNRAGGTLVASGTSTSVTTGETAVVDVDIPAGDFVWLRTTAQSGTVLSFAATVSGIET
jgi:hypothetical protein